MRRRRLTAVWTLGMMILTCMLPLVHASSHREAPFITEMPKVDGTDFYMFRSYEPGRQDFVTLVANYLPLQDSYGGPNYFFLDDDALYEIHLDSDGDAQEDVTFQFAFGNVQQDITLPIGNSGDTRNVSVPLINVGPIGPGVNDTANLNLIEQYTLKIVRGDRRTGMAQDITNADTGETTFIKPVDNIGRKSIANYEDYARNHIYPIKIPGCDDGRVFVGQRRESFFVNLGEVFDLVNIPNPIGEQFADDMANVVNSKNITSLVLEVPISCLTRDDAGPVVGGWTTASLRQARILNPQPSTDPSEQGATVEGGAFTQVSRLSSPLVNEVIIGVKDKDRFNASEPKNDAQFLQYVTHPTLPEILEILFGAAGVKAPDIFPRDDLVAAFLTGLPASALPDVANQPANVTPSEMMRLNTAVTVTPRDSQSRLGVLGGDPAGFPNGRRPGDDVVDIELRVAMGRLIPILLGTDQIPFAGSFDLDFTDGAFRDATDFDNRFPYLVSPLPGSPVEESKDMD